MTKAKPKAPKKIRRKWVWTKADMQFHDPELREFHIIPAWTRGHLLKPVGEHAEHFKALERYQKRTGRKFWLVKLEGRVRYIEADRLMTESEWNERRERLRRDGVLSED